MATRPVRPAIFGTYDPDRVRPVSHVECDGQCACAQELFEPVVGGPPVDLDHFYTVPELHTADLDGEHALFFNPLGAGGVVVLNGAARTFLDGFRAPASLQSQIAGQSDGHLWAALARKLVKLDILVPVEREHVPPLGTPETLVVWLHVTNACNLRCAYCYLHKTPDEMDVAHGRLAIDALFRSAVNHGFKRVKIKYAGGEATLNLRTVIALHEYAAERAAEHEMALKGVILSNGVAFGPRIIDAIQKADLQVMISLDGVGAYHDAQRTFINGTGSFAHVERSLDRLQAAGVTPFISITITNRNVGGLVEAVRYVMERGLPFNLNFFRDNECASSLADLRFQDQAMVGALRDVFAVLAEDVPRHSLLNSILDRARLDTAHQRACGVGHNYLVIDQNGGVAKCQMEIEQRITDIYEEDPLAVIRADSSGVQNPAVDEKEGCRECSWRYWCAGGCPLLTYRTTGRYDVKSPNCNIYQTLFPAVLRLEGLRLLQHADSLV